MYQSSLDRFVQRGVVVRPSVDIVQVVVFGDTDVPAASQSGIVNETLGCSAVHDAMGIVWHNEAHIYHIRRFHSCGQQGRAINVKSCPIYRKKYSVPFVMYRTFFLYLPKRQLNVVCIY